MDFPYKKYYMKPPKYYFNNLKNYNPVYLNTNNYYIDIHNNRYKYDIIIKYNISDYDKINILTDYFTENIRMRAIVKNSKYSPYDYYIHNKKSINALINKYDYPDLLQRIYLKREYIFNNCKEATTFKLTSGYSVIKYLCKINNIDITKIKVLDPSCGWGDRLIIFTSLNVKQYVGFDPNKKLKSGYENILETLGTKRQQNNYIIHYEGFENSTYENEFDIVFTSPPYFDVEMYSDDKEQSMIKYNSHNKWKYIFFKKYIINCYKACKKGGIICIHIVDSKSLDIVNYLHLIMKELKCKEYKTCGIMGKNIKRVFPVWCFIK